MYPKISVIVPIYNVEKYLERCIESIINQSYKNLEIILVNDGSPDNSSRICNKYKKIDGRIIYYKNENMGVAAARNFGIDKSTGEYIIFIDSDDYLKEDMILKLYNNLIENDSDFSICNYYWTYDDGTMKPNKYEENILISEDNKYDNLYNKNHLLMSVPWNKLFKRSIFDNVRFKVGMRNEDELIVHKELEAAKRISFVLEPLYYYIQRSNSYMNVFKVNRYDVMIAFDEREKFFKANNQKDLIRKNLILTFDVYLLLLKERRGVKFTKEEKKILRKFDRKCKKVCFRMLFIKVRRKKKTKALLYLINKNSLFYIYKIRKILKRK